MIVYYNEFDPKAAAWLRELIKQGHLPEGYVDERSITDVKAEDLKGYTQCHFFAGIGGWPLALQIAGWPSDRPVWTGSCPCQPFSQANSWKRDNDPRADLWSAFYRLISERCPPIVFGEQVASPDGLAWFDTVHADLENQGYAAAAADLCAAGIGAPHIRQRLYWVAISGRERFERERLRLLARGPQQARIEAWRRGEAGNVADTDSVERGARRAGVENGRDSSQPAGRGTVGSRPVGDSSGAGSGRDSGAISGAQAYAERRLRRESHIAKLAGTAGSPVGNADGARSQGRSERGFSPDELSPWTTSVAYVDCSDGKARPIESGSFPLAHGVPGRVGLLRGYGNAIVPQLAATFIQAVMEA